MTDRGWDVKGLSSPRVAPFLFHERGANGAKRREKKNGARLRARVCAFRSPLPPARRHQQSAGLSQPSRSPAHTMASETKGLFRSLTRSKSKKKATSAAAHGHSSSTDGGGGLVHQPPSLAAWGQANSAAGAGLAGVGGIGAGGLGRAATLREKTRAQMGGLVPASSSSSAAAAAGSAGPSSSSSGGPHPLPVGSGAAAAAAAVQDQMSRSMSQGQLVSQSPLRPTQPLAELNNSQRSAGDQVRACLPPGASSLFPFSFVSAPADRASLARSHGDATSSPLSRRNAAG